MSSILLATFLAVAICPLGGHAAPAKRTLDLVNSGGWNKRSFDLVNSGGWKRSLDTVCTRGINWHILIGRLQVASDNTMNKRGLDLIDSGGFTNSWGKRGLDLVNNGGFTNSWGKRGLDLVDNGGFTNGWGKRGLDLVDNGGFTNGWGKRGLDLVCSQIHVFMQTNRHTGGRRRLPGFVAQTKSRHDQQWWLWRLVN
jgi:hypothetical protein